MCPLTGTYVFTFRIYTAASGGSSIWDEVQTLPVTKGLWNATLGINQSLSLPFNQQYWLGVKVGSDAEMAPRIMLTNAPYTFRGNVTEYLSSGTVALGNIDINSF